MMKVFESFAGYGSQSIALRKIGIDYEVVGISEIDKYALQAYGQIHGHCPNFGDICKIDWNSVPDFDLFTYSFPCTDLSLAGLQKGMDRDSGTRSSLLYECEKAIETKKPKFLLMENVKNLVGKQFINQFLEWQNYLSRLGYVNFAAVLNAKYFGVPQNRERGFLVSILGGGWYNFPENNHNIKRLSDILEPNVDEKYFLSKKMINSLEAHAAKHKEKGNGFGFTITNTDKPAKTIIASGSCRPSDNYIKVIGKIDGRRDDTSRVYGDTGICPTLVTAQGGGQVPKILQLNQSKESNGVQPYQQNRVYDTDSIVPTISTTNPPNIIQKGRGFNKGGTHKICPTLTSNSWQQNNFLEDKEYRIRRLTPREYFRLMGVSDSDFDKLVGISNSQLYKMAGNSIVVPVLEAIFKNLFSSS